MAKQNNMRLKATNTVAGGTATDIQGIPLALIQSAGLSRSGSIQGLDGKRLARNVKTTDCKILTRTSWRAAIPLSAKADSPLAA